MFHRSSNFMYIILPLLILTAIAQTAANRYTLILEDPPVVQRFESSAASRTKEAVTYREQIAEKQKVLREELNRRKFQVTGSVNTVLNAVFVIAPTTRVDELKGLPGVKAVIPGRRFHRNLNRATQLLDAPSAWNLLGGIQKAGSGVKIAMLDSGIDQTHPALQDDTLTMPAGFPICSGSDCAWTSNKVIVARSYVKQLAAGSADNPAADSRPDDYSPRDRDGHGTAVASCAAGSLNTGLVTFSGFAPKAWLGNYKIYGSPGVNDGTTDDVIVKALEDAYNDGMDVINFSSGGPAFSGPLDNGSVCGNNAGVPCDLVAQTVEALAGKGIIIVVAAGNEGNDGVSSALPGYNTIGSPADAPSVIAVGAATNSHSFAEVVGVADPAAPSSVHNIVAEAGDAPLPTGAVTGNLVDVTSLGNDGYACSTLPAGSLVGAIALIERNNCTFSAKVSNAEDAGALGVILYMADASALVVPTGLSNSGIPAAMIPNSSGLALKTYANANPGSAATLDAAGLEQSEQSDDVTIFSSLGPTAGDAALKPDVLGIGQSVYMAGENYDRNGALFSANRYVVADGTSFSTPMVAGAAALVKQQHPNWTAAQVKSALANTAGAVQSDEAGNPVDSRSFGGGLLDAAGAVNASVTANPSNLSFGAIGSGSLPKTQQLQLTNSGSARVSLTISVAAAVPSTRASIGVDHTSLTLDPNATGTINVALTGSVPAAGAYSGNVVIQGSGVSLHIPYLYLVPSGISANLIPLTGDAFDGIVGGGIPDGFLSFRLVDANGLPVVGAPVLFGARGGAIQSADSATDRYGIATAVPVLGSQPGNVTFTATAGGLRYVYSGFARPQPTIAAGGITNAASGQSGAAAPGSYITIYGSGLSDFSDYAQSANLPLAIDQAFVSFDVPSAGISVPGHLTYVSPGQVNVQVPWELQGQTSAQVKVTIDYSYGNVVTLPLTQSAPAIFHGPDGIAAALDQQNAVVTTGNPVRRGQLVQLFANGLGQIANQPTSGEPAPVSPLATTTTAPIVTIGGQTATVMFSGLAPGFAGLYQINATVPNGLSPGMQSVSISIAGAASPSVSLPVQ